MITLLASAALTIATPSAIDAAAVTCGLAKSDLSWTQIEPKTLSLTRISPTIDSKKFLCFGKWLKDQGIRTAVLSAPLDPQ
ncbi:hypothetical protein ACFOMD_09650 [Sphingoaurantiacus capsulatus]|uniref:Uncharacterized protein n=1 Tax=Sphingoaurantiacus capsulatus TaxID=1771310 RepID=A0ABV7X9P2_9SPHN